MSAATTLVAVVGPGASEAVRRAAQEAANVSAEPVEQLPDDPIESAGRLREAWRRAGSHGLVYTLVDADPLALVVRHWAARLQGEAHQLELVAGLVADLPMPDYYLVSPSLGEPLVHWYLGLLEDLRPARVNPVEMTPSAFLAALRGLAYEEPFPKAAEVAARAAEFVPLPELSRATL